MAAEEDMRLLSFPYRVLNLWTLRSAAAQQAALEMPAATVVPEAEGHPLPAAVPGPVPVLPWAVPAAAAAMRPLKGVRIGL